ncbi:LacI family DNA-binding transcriptional regulator [Paenibacillus vini]|uniref:LacI family DNA-binding transcriptional regulator n=1 Tax=Paenibacillus vini TaxID=1476024 RepID=UPI0025B64EE0|nr:LacI family DNA-binding transcriptional regulator [Paenibacillus vini]MDN4070072.1 LacI family DNA-binding transcriptional regulator [Paenibacillus vini]
MSSTIKDVAKQAGVSVATVSRVLNNLPGYSEETKRRVEQAVEELGYQPNAIARGLVNRRTETIGVLFPSVSSSFSSEILHGIEEVAHKHNYSVIVCNTAEDGKRTMKYLQVLREKRVDGIIYSSGVLEPEYYEAVQAMGVPLVLVATKSDWDDVPFIKVDDRQAAYDAAAYLISQGHREIAMIGGGESDRIAGQPRYEGFRQALRDHGLPLREDHVQDGGFTFEGGCGAAERLLTASPEVTAVFAAGDEMAIAVISVAARLGIAVPDQLAVIGYDNLKLAEMSNPPLTTVAQPLHEMGRMASEKLIEMLATGQPAASEVVPHRVIERQTVKKR